MIVKGDKHDWAKGGAGILIVFVLFSIFLLFINKQDELMRTTSYQPFIILTFIAGAFLLGLFYLVNNSQTKKVKVHHKSSKSSKKKGK